MRCQLRSNLVHVEFLQFANQVAEGVFRKRTGLHEHTDAFLEGDGGGDAVRRELVELSL